MNKPTVHLICNAHLDPVWQWQWEEGCAEALSTFRVAVDLLNQFDDFIFNHNEAILYDWVRKYDPKLFREIQTLVKLNKWQISGGWYLQPDLNIPQTESIIRHILEGQIFFKKYFSVTPKTAYNFDSFGHSGGLPQILKKAGYKMYVHMRPQKNDLTLPADLYKWRGVDGSEIMSYRIEVGLYHTEFENLQQRIEEGIKLALALNRDVPVFWGIGDHGGGATNEDLLIIEELIKKETRVNLIHSSTEMLYESFSKFENDLPIYQGGLQRVFTGCYTSLSRIKRTELKSYSEVTQAEMFETLSWWRLNDRLDNSKIKSIWHDHLFNDFHDILPGTCTEPAEKDALDLYGKVCNESRKIKLQAAIDFSNGNNQKLYLPITVLNTTPYKSKIPIECEFMISHRPKWEGKWHVRLFRIDGKEIECQEEWPEAKLPFNHWRRKICFTDIFNGAGAYHYYVEAIKGEKEIRDFQSNLNIRFNNSSMIDKIAINDFNFLNGPLFKPLVVEDNGDSWGTDIWEYRNVIGEFQVVNSSVIEEGSIRKIVETTCSYNNSRIILQYIIYSEFSFVEIKARVHWNEPNRLKFSIPTKLVSGKIICEIPGGIIEREADGSEQVHSRWMITHGIIDRKDLALGIINNGTHGFDSKDGEIRLSALRSPVYCHEQGLKFDNSKYLNRSDQGVHDFRFLIIPGTLAEVKSKINGLADLINNPPAVYSHLPIGENLSDVRIKIAPPSIRLLAVKRSENSEDILIRIQESSGIAGAAKFSLWDLNHSFELSALEIKTFRITRSNEISEVDLITEK